MEDFEKLGVFYLGREYDLATKERSETPLLYDAKDLVTHAVCVGMTGSGKTGLCVGLVEEAAIDGVPAILIDPKGDLTNLLLTFPELRGEDFLPWINLDDARRKNLSAADYAEQQAQLWQKGLADWGQSGDRIRRLREAAEFAVYTPGSTAGLPVSVLKSFEAPDADMLSDADLLRKRINTTVSSLLGLVGIDADPVQSRDYILLATILETSWRAGKDLDLASLIQQVQSPPVSKIGVLDLESFYPAKDRFGLVMMLNNLLASPSFGAWLEGAPLDIGRMLYTESGKPRVAIFSIAHLSDAERMFFVSLLLNQIVGWMRTQSGTTSLRALVYMDEIFGFFPPVGNPPSKLPLLTLLKQARAFGVGVVLATQNPVDLDYKGLSNAGTWFVGRLQTERDKARLLDGLEGAAAGAGSGFNRQAMEQTISALGSRVFLLNNVHEDAPVIFQTRWVLSYLRGPLTLDDIRRLTPPAAAGVSAPAPAPASTSSPTPATAAMAPQAGLSAAAAPAVEPAPPGTGPLPALDPRIATYFVSPRGSGPVSTQLVYYPRLLGAGKVSFVDDKANVDVTQDVAFLTAVSDSPVPVDWNAAEAVDLYVPDLEQRGPDDAYYAELPPPASQRTNYTAWRKDFSDWLYGSQRVEILQSSLLGEYARPDEYERDFRIRLQQTAREQRDQAVAALRAKYDSKLASLQERLRKAQQAVEREASQARNAQLQTAVSLGATLLGAFLGRKAISTTTVSKAATTARGVGRSLQQQQDVTRATETVEAVQEQIGQLEAELAEEIRDLEARYDPLSEQLATITVKPRRADVDVDLVSLIWAPYWQDEKGRVTPAWT